MALYGLKRSYVYKRACVDGWRRIYDERTGRPYVKYHIDDIDESLGRDPVGSVG